MRSSARPRPDYWSFALPVLGLILALTSCAAGGGAPSSSPVPLDLKQQESVLAKIVTEVEATSDTRPTVKTFREESCLDPALENPAHETKWILSLELTSDSVSVDDLLAAATKALDPPVSTAQLDTSVTRISTQSGLNVNVQRAEDSLLVGAVGRCTRNPEEHVMLKNRLDQGPDGSAPVRFSDE